VRVHEQTKTGFVPLNQSSVRPGTELRIAKRYRLR